MITKFIRTCQECFNEQEMKHPNSYKNENWRELKCRKCKSEALDYGSYMYFEDDGITKFKSEDHNDE